MFNALGSSWFTALHRRLVAVVQAITLAALLWPSAALALAPADAPDTRKLSVEMRPLPPGFGVASADWVKIATPASLEHWRGELLQEAKLFRDEVRARLDAPVLDQPIEVRLADNAAAMTELAPIGAPYPSYAAGVAYGRLRLILLTAAPVHPGEAHDVRTTFRHELAHIALRDAVQNNAVPLWFNEGLAVHLSREDAFARTRSLWAASVSGNLLPLSVLDDRFPSDAVGVPLAYAQSADIVRYLLRTEDQERFRLLISRLGRGQTFDRALYDAYDMDAYNLEQNWRMDVDSRFSFWPALLSGTVLWTGAVVLVTLAWRRKRTKQKVTLARWAREEAREEAARQQRLVAEAPKPPKDPEPPPPWMHDRPSSDPAPASRRDSPVPKVEHDGDWHTLH
jgi:hypothetical protein